METFTKLAKLSGLSQLFFCSLMIFLPTACLLLLPIIPNYLIAPHGGVSKSSLSLVVRAKTR